MSDQFASVKKSLPFLGTGLGLRRELADQIFSELNNKSSRIDWLEIVPENYIEIGGAAYERLEHARAISPVITHGINLSIGSIDELNYSYLKSLKALLKRIEAPWWSDHLCFSSTSGLYFQDLLPLPFSQDAVKHVVNRIRQVQNIIDCPFIIENISYYMTMPGSELTEAEFLSEVLERADCGLLLDVNNVYVNSLNHNFDAIEFLDKLPLERVVQLHIAGHKRIGKMIIDTHGAAIAEPVYDLLRYVLSKTDPKAILLERDQNFSDFNDLLAELANISEISRLLLLDQAHAGDLLRLPEPTNILAQGA